MISIDIDDGPVLDALNRLFARTNDLSPVLIKIGERMQESTQERFRTGTAPDGSAWKDKSDVTKAIYGGLWDKPLVGNSGRLSGEIARQLDGKTAVMIGSPMIYASMHQFGGVTSPNSMIPGKEIPARPYLGLSDDDEQSILDIVHSYLLES